MSDLASLLDKVRSDLASTDSSLVERLSADRDEALRYATNLLTSYVNKYCDPVPEWAPLPDLIGVLTQIDNASTVTADILAQSQAAEARISSLERELEEARAQSSHFHQAYVEADDNLIAAEAKVARMGEALKPFAEYAPFVRMFVEGRASQGGSPMLPTRHFKLADFERAESALQSEKDREGH